MSVSATVKVCVVGAYCGLGLTVPIFPTAIAMIAVIMVRVLVWTKTKSLTWNIAVCALACMAAFVTVEGSDVNSFRGFWIGVGYGALGVGILEVGKSNITAAIKSGFETALKGLAASNKDEPK